MKAVSGTFISSDAAVNVECGFIPDFVEAISAIGGTELIHRWYRALYDAAQTGQHGLVDDGAGVLTHNASAAAGIIPYDTKALKAMLPAPNGSGEKAATIYGSFAAAKAASVTPTARTIAVLGTVIRPTTQNGYLYECTISGGAMTSLTEPTWGTTLGGTTSDGSNTWICREEKLKEVGVKGFTIGVDKATDGEIWAFKAELHDRSADMGDADAENPVLFN